MHEPLEVPDEYRAPYNDSTRSPFVPNQQWQTYCAMATALDSAVGVIVDAVNETGKLPETLIVPYLAGMSLYRDNIKMIKLTVILPTCQSARNFVAQDTYLLAGVGIYF